MVYYVIMHHVTLEEGVKIFYYYYFPLLNHFRNKDYISFPFLPLHFMEDYVWNIREKCEEGKNCNFYQALISFLFKFYKGLYPLILSLSHSPLKITNQSSPPPTKFISKEDPMATARGIKEGKLKY